MASADNMRFLTLKVFSFCSSSKPLIDKLFIVDEATGARYLRDLIKDAVNEKDDKIEFNAKDGETKKIVGNGGTDLSALLDHPSNLVPAQFNTPSLTLKEQTTGTLAFAAIAVVLMTS